MTPISLGDLAQSFQLRHQNTELKTRLGTLAQELSTGVAADLGRRVSGDFAPLSSIERSLNTLAAYRTAGTEAALTTATMQASLQSLSGAVSDLSPSLLLAGNSLGDALVTTTGVDSASKLEQAVAALNTTVAGRALFAGASTDQTALAPAKDIIAGLKAATAGQTTADGVMAAAQAWFDTPGGGFETLIYGGSDTPAGPVRLAEDQSLRLDVSASDPALREVLRGFATAALLADPTVLAGDEAGRATLAKRVGEHLLTAEGPLSTLRAEIGGAQNRIETIQAENASHAAMLELARSELIGTDPYETATELEAVQGQLETLYAVTARLSRLNLADYLS